MNSDEEQKNLFSNFQVKNVAFSFEKSGIKRVRIDGHSDISGHEKVLKEYDDGGKLVEIEGTLEYKEATFKFLIGHTVGQIGVTLGHIKIAKKTEKTDDNLLIELNQIFLDNYFKIFAK